MAVPAAAGHHELDRQALPPATEAARACSWKDIWTFHWTRHPYATYSFAPTTRGGYGLELKRVQASLGYADAATTQRIYLQKPPATRTTTGRSRHILGRLC